MDKRNQIITLGLIDILGMTTITIIMGLLSLFLLYSLFHLTWVVIGKIVLWIIGFIIVGTLCDGNGC